MLQICDMLWCSCVECAGLQWENPAGVFDGTPGSDSLLTVIAVCMHTPESEGIEMLIASSALSKWSTSKMTFCRIYARPGVWDVFLCKEIQAAGTPTVENNSSVRCNLCAMYKNSAEVCQFCLGALCFIKVLFFFFKASIWKPGFKSNLWANFNNGKDVQMMKHVNTNFKNIELPS